MLAFVDLLGSGVENFQLPPRPGREPGGQRMARLAVPSGCAV